MKEMLGKKLGMTQFYKENDAFPVTIIQTGPCVVVQVKKQDTDGYNAVQLGFDEVKKEKKINKPIKGHFTKNKVKFMKYIHEVKTEPEEKFETNQTIRVEEVFKTGDVIKVSGISKGKGFQGVIKRFNAKGGPGGHGSRHHRAPGSIGASSDPSRVFKGTTMPGRMGCVKRSVRNLKVIDIERDSNLLIVGGSVPGNNGSFLVVTKS